MNDEQNGRVTTSDGPQAAPPHSEPGNIDTLLTVTHLVYALHAFAVVSGLAGTATILGSFLASIPSIAAVVINYWKRGEARGTWLESHFRWQIRTFWFALLWVVLALFMIMSVIGIFFGLFTLLATSLWVVYRVARGWWNLGQRATMPVPAEPL